MHFKRSLIAKQRRKNNFVLVLSWLFYTMQGKHKSMLYMWPLDRELLDQPWTVRVLDLDWTWIIQHQSNHPLYRRT